MTHDYAYHKQWRHDRHNGITRTVDATPVRLHIGTLTGAGMSLRSIGGEADVSATALSSILRGQDRCKRDLATRVLNVQPGIGRKASRATTEPFVPKVGAVRRIQALLALGWTHALLHDQCGIRTHLILSQQGRWITLTTYEAIEGAYTKLSMTPGPSARTRGRAAARGYLPPLAWDDIDTDTAAPTDPTQDQAPELDEVAIERRMAGDRTVELTKAEKHELAARWQATGRPLSELEHLTGLNSHRYLPETA